MMRWINSIGRSVNLAMMYLVGVTGNRAKEPGMLRMTRPTIKYLKSNILMWDFKLAPVSNNEW